MPQNLALDRLVRKEVALGLIREPQLRPLTHIGLDSIAPFMDVESDDVIFDYAKVLVDGLAPARAEDAESELAQKDELWAGIGRASVIDWSLKDHYTASDVSRYREALVIAEQTRDTLSLPLTIRSMTDGFQNKVARDTALRRRKLDNRLEWLIMTALDLGVIAYNDGKIKFTVDFGRPSNQNNQAPASGHTWDQANSDPIGDIIAIQQFMFNTYGIKMGRAITSRKVLLSVMNSDRFIARSGMALPSGGSGGSAASPSTLDPRYFIDGWGPEAAMAVIERQTGTVFEIYDSVYNSRTVGTNTRVMNRFTTEDKIIFLPDADSVNQIDDTQIGFAKTLTSPHPEGNWTPGYYEWEQETMDPWGHDMGVGIKAFPVFPHMDMTYTMVPLP